MRSREKRLHGCDRATVRKKASAHWFEARTRVIDSQWSVGDQSKVTLVYKIQVLTVTDRRSLTTAMTLPSEAPDDSRRTPHIVLLRAQIPRMHVVSLQPPG